jgi:hypothetical protein
MTTPIPQPTVAAGQIPHAEAFAAMHLYNNAFVGVPDTPEQFWQSLPEDRKDYIRRLVTWIKEAPREQTP